MQGAGSEGLPQRRGDGAKLTQMMVLVRIQLMGATQSAIPSRN